MCSPRGRAPSPRPRRRRKAGHDHRPRGACGRLRRRHIWLGTGRAHRADHRCARPGGARRHHGRGPIGKLGTTIARAALAAGYDVAISGSGPAERIALTIDVLAPGARAVTTAEVVRHADLIVLAVPTHRFRELPRDLFVGKIMIDPMNYWEPIDGVDEELAAAPDGTSVVVQERFPSARVVKSLNQLGYHELDESRRPAGAPDRIGIAAAG